MRFVQESTEITEDCVLQLDQIAGQCSFVEVGFRLESVRGQVVDVFDENNIALDIIEIF